MGIHSVAMTSALDADLRMACGMGYDELRRIPHLPPDSSHVLASAWSIANSFWKKFLPKESSKQDQACYAKFLVSNERSRTWQLRLNTSLDEELWGTWKQELYNFFYPKGVPLIDSLDSIFLSGKVGPGAAIGAVNGDFYSKIFASPLTCTSQGLVKHYESMVRRFPEWFSAESFRSQHLSAPRIVQGSRLSFVPKNDTISRSICVEPSLNMYYQLGLGQILTERLNRYFRINLETQPDRNAELAHRGSIDGSWSTIDLESASDTISYALIKEVLPSAVVTYLDLLRSPRTELKGEGIELHMISSMGNGYTFPLQTILFAAMVKAVYRCSGLQERVAVFGDDIVVLSTVRHRMLRLIELAGFIVNPAKSFFEGPFRESCGYDYFSGRNIRGVYVKSIDTLQDLFAVINACNRFTARTGLLLRTLVQLLADNVDRSCEIPPWEDPSGGIQLPYNMINSRRVSETTQGTVYSLYCFKARKIRIGEDKIYTSRRRKKILYNPSGLLLAFVSGMALSSGLPLRNEGHWKKKRRSCSSWNSFGSRTEFQLGFALRQWESAAYYNLFRV